MIECETADRDANTLTYIAISEPISSSKSMKLRTFTANLRSEEFGIIVHEIKSWSLKPIGETGETGESLASLLIFFAVWKKTSGIHS